MMPPDRLRTADDIVGFIALQRPMMDILRVVEALDLPDCWVGAGFVRNVVWDVLHDRPWGPSYGDIDVVYFDAGNAHADRDIAIEARLKRSMTGYPWSVKNQARMHDANGDPPYADMADALAHWPETCTAVAIRSAGPRIELLAPFGVSDLVILTVRPTPAFAGKLDIYRARIAGKQWARRWPRLRIGSLGD
jgi:hypothetical protein